MLSELNTKQHNSLKNLTSPKGNRGSNGSNQGQLSIDFQRLIASNLEKENKALHEELEYLRIKSDELESKKNRETGESSLIKDLINQLKLNTEKELYKRVLYLKEFYHQNKEQRKLIQKLSQFVAHKCNKQQVNLKEIWNFFISGVS